MNTLNFPNRLKAAGVHLGLSALVGILAAVLVFGLWYPAPFREISGGQSLFILIVSVDLVLGPALTLVVFSPGKAKTVLMRDLLVIAALQLGGLAYGLHTVFQARPIAMVYEPGRFRVVTNADIMQSELGQALPELRRLPLTGPKLLGTRESRDGDEQFQAIQMALQGVDIGQRPSYWQPYQASVKHVLAEARPIEDLFKQYPAAIRDIQNHLADIGQACCRCALFTHPRKRIHLERPGGCQNRRDRRLYPL